MIAALTCLFYIQSFPSEFYAYMSDTWGSGNLLTLSVPSPAHHLKMREIQIEKHTHTHTHQPTHSNLIKIESSLESEGNK